MECDEDVRRLRPRKIAGGGSYDVYRNFVLFEDGEDTTFDLIDGRGPLSRANRKSGNYRVFIDVIRHYGEVNLQRLTQKMRRFL